MGFVHADRVKETSTTTGTGTYSLAGAATGFRTFVAGVGNGNRCIYCAENGTDWEINEGVVTDAAPDTLTRAKLLASSTGSAINWAAGTRNLFAVYAAAFTNPVVKALTADYTNSTTTGTEVTGLSVDLEPGTYTFDYYLVGQVAAIGTGIDFGVNFTGTQTRFAQQLMYQDSGSTATAGTFDGTVTADAGELIIAGGASLSLSTTTPSIQVITGAVTASEDALFQIRGVIVVSVAGQLELWARSDVAASNIILQTGSSLVLHRTN